jgi:hypothetical protein
VDNLFYFIRVLRVPKWTPSICELKYDTTSNQTTIRDHFYWFHFVGLLGELPFY